MLDSTLELIRAGLKTDQTLAPGDRAKIISLIRGNGKAHLPPPPDTGPRLLRRSEAAARLGRTVRNIDQLCQQGILVKRKFPGRQRSAGILESSLVAAISAAA